MAALEFYIGIFAGVLVRTIVPYLVKLKKEPKLKWNNKYFVSAFAGLILSLITAVLLANSIGSNLDFLTAFCTAFTLQSLTRETQKVLGY